MSAEKDVRPPQNEDNVDDKWDIGRAKAAEATAKYDVRMAIGNGNDLCKRRFSLCDRDR